MSLAPAMEREYGAALNEAQRAVVCHSEGPLLVIAGPGSGKKTFSLVLRTLNLLLSGKAEPSEIVVCTFAEKAARELEDRLAGTAATLGYGADLSALRVGTIHGICNGILQDFRHHTPLSIPPPRSCTSKAVVNEIGPPLRCLPSSIARDPSERPTHRRQTQERSSGPISLHNAIAVVCC